MTSQFDSHGAQFAWDSTSIKLAQECHYKYKLKMIDGWGYPNKSVHLLFGGWYASALERFHKFRAAGVEYLDAVVDVVHQALIETWTHERNEFDQPVAGTGQAWLSDHNTKTRDNLIRTIVWYLDQFENDPAETVILANGKPAIEYSFRLQVDDDIILSGHLDRLVTYANHHYIQDQKTTGTTLTPRFFEGFNPDTQMSLYTFAGKIIYNIPVHGVMIDAAQIAVGFSRFERGMTFRTEDQLNEWYDNTMQDIALIREATINNEFRMNPTACGNYGGCEFRQICSKSRAVREQYLAANFVKGKPWNPLESR